MSYTWLGFCLFSYFFNFRVWFAYPVSWRTWSQTLFFISLPQPRIYFSGTWFMYIYSSQVAGSYTDILLRNLVPIKIYFSGTRWYTSQVPGSYTEILLRYQVHIHIYFPGTWFTYIYTSLIPGLYTDILFRYQVHIHIYFSGTWFTYWYTSQVPSSYRYTSQVPGSHTYILLRYMVYIHIYFSGTRFTYIYTSQVHGLHTDKIFRYMVYIQIYFWCMFLLGLYLAIYFTLQKTFVALVVSKPPPPLVNKIMNAGVLCTLYLSILSWYTAL